MYMAWAVGSVRPASEGSDHHNRTALPPPSLHHHHHRHDGHTGHGPAHQHVGGYGYDHLPRRVTVDQRLSPYHHQHGSVGGSGRQGLQGHPPSHVSSPPCGPVVSHGGNQPSHRRHQQHGLGHHTSPHSHHVGFKFIVLIYTCVLCWNVIQKTLCGVHAVQLDVELILMILI